MKRAIPFLTLFTISLTTAVSALASTSRAELYSKILAQVNETHDSALVTASTPFLFDEQKIQEFARTFIAEHCAGEKNLQVLSPACNKLFGRVVSEVLHQRYFAADPQEIQNHCRAEPLTCEDAGAYEVLFRSAHNTAIEHSRTEKQRLLDSWRSGRMADHELEQALQMRIDFTSSS